MAWNVPDDWNSYYRNCGDCGGRYHASEGGCGCLDELEPCQCGNCSWERDFNDDYFCSDCNTGPAVVSFKRVATHIARKEHGDHIKPGDTYDRVVEGGYWPGGARWMYVRKLLVRKAGETAEEAAMIPF